MTNTASKEDHPMIHRVHNFAAHAFEQSKSTCRIEDGHESVAVSRWIEIPPADGPNPGEAIVTDEQLAFMKASRVGSAWFKPDPITGRPQLVVVESFPAPAASPSDFSVRRAART